MALVQERLDDMNINFNELSDKGKVEFIDSVIGTLPWIFLDRMMRETRTKLENDFAWRMGGERVQKLYEKNSGIAREELGRLPRRFMDFGAGKYHPLANALLFWLDGAERCVAVEKDTQFLPPRSAVALLDLVCAVITDPQQYMHQDVDLMEKVKALNLPALKRGEFEDGLGSAPLSRYCGDVQELDEGDFDFVASQSVLEHVHSFDEVIQALYDRTAPQGIHTHNIEMKDHRYFTNPKAFSMWEFLFTEEGDNGLCNRLRCSEIQESFERAGFVIRSCVPQFAQPPEDIRARLIPRFQHLSDVDLATTAARFIVQRP